MIAERHDQPQWRRSSYCYGGNCVEARAHDGRVLLRDSKRPERPAIALEPWEWAAFTALVRDAEWGDSFDLTVAA